MKIFFLFILFSFNLVAEDMAFQLNENLTSIQDQRVIEVGRTRSQDNIGSCFSFVFAKQIEYICQRDTQCAADLGSDEVSPLYLMNKINNGIDLNTNGANTDMILNAFNHQAGNSLELIKESCAPFDQSVYRRFITENSYYEDESIGIELLQGYYQQAKEQECDHCNTEMAEEIKSHLTDLDIQIPALANVLSQVGAMSEAEFVSRILIQNHCHAESNKVTTPPFSSHDLGTDKLTSPEIVIETLEQLIDLGRLPNLNICTGPLGTNNQRSCGGHAVIINGHRTVCDVNGLNCKKELKVQNSWGQSWQSSNNDGWVDAMTLARLAIMTPNADGSLRPTRSGGLHVSNVINWLEPTRRPTPPPARVVPPIQRIEPSPERAPTPAPLPSTNNTNFNYQAGEIYQCIKDNQKSFSSVREDIVNNIANGYSCSVYRL